MRPRRLLAAAVPLAALAACLLSCASTAGVSDVYTALDGDGNRKRTEFRTDSKEIHCVAEGSFGRRNVTVEGFIRQVSAFDPGRDDFTDADSITAYAELVPGQTPQGGAQQKLDILLLPVNEKGEPDDKAPFVAGSYICEIQLDGEVVKQTKFNIAFAECPEIVIVPGSPCIGFFRPKVECNQFGRKSTAREQCTCSTKGIWEC